MNRRETSAEAPHPPIELGPPFTRHQDTVRRSDSPVKPTSEVAHQPGQQPAALNPEALIHDLAIVLAGSLHPSASIGPSPRLAARRLRDVLKIAPSELVKDIERKLECGLGSCGGVQHRETKSAGDTTGGACGGSRDSVRQKRAGRRVQVDGDIERREHQAQSLP